MGNQLRYVNDRKEENGNARNKYDARNEELLDTFKSELGEAEETVNFKTVNSMYIN